MKAIKQKRELINKSIIYLKLSGIKKDFYSLEKIDKYTYRLITYYPIHINDKLGYYFKVSFDYNHKNKFSTYLVSTKNYRTIQK